MCQNCNQNNCNECTQEVHICNQCSPEPCDCPIADLSTDCVNYDQDAIMYGANIVVPKNTILSLALDNIVQFLKLKIEEIQNYFKLVNTGTGVSIYSGVNLLGEKKLRKLKSTDNSVTITEGINDINFSVTVNDGSETKLNAGTNTTVTGNGTIATPYVVNSATYSAANIGAGANVYKDSTGTQFNLRKIKTENSGTGEEILKAQVENTNDISIIAKKIKSSDNSVVITSSTNEIDLTIYTPPDTGIPRFTVNKDYIGGIETGSISQPFKTIESALIAFVGSGTPISPEFGGATVYIQKTTTVYTYTGNLEYNGLFLEVESGATIISNPSVGNYLANYDNLNGLLNIDSTIILNENAEIQLTKRGFKNTGTTPPPHRYYKILRVKGSGRIRNLSDTIVSASIKTVFESNFESTVGYANPSAATFAVSGITIISYNSPILMQGGASTSLFSNINFEYCSPSALLMNSSTPIFNLTGGVLQITNARGLVQIDSVSEVIENIFLTEELNSFNITIQIDNTQILGTCDNFLYNTSATELNTLDFIKLSTDSLGINALFVKTDTAAPQPVNMHFCSVGGASTILSSAEMSINSVSINEIALQTIATLPIYTSKNAASTAGLFKGSLFTNKVDVTAGAFVTGVEYKILTIGTTDFTLIGAASNTVGLYFTASGVGTGTGTASLIRLDIVV